MINFHHIGIFVSNISVGEGFLSKSVNAEVTGPTVTDDIIGVEILFMQDCKGLLYEIVAPHGPDSPVHGVLKRGKDLLNHLAYVTTDFETEIISHRKLGCIPLGPPLPAVAFSGAKVIFFMTPLGYIHEIIEGPL